MQWNRVRGPYPLQRLPASAYINPAAPALMRELDTPSLSLDPTSPLRGTSPAPWQ